MKKACEKGRFSQATPNPTNWRQFDRFPAKLDFPGFQKKISGALGSSIAILAYAHGGWSLVSEIGLVFPSRPRRCT
jgi:hypothetical protein